MRAVSLPVPEENEPRPLPPSIRVVLEPERQAVTGIPRATYHRLEVAGKVPKRRLLPNGRVGWLLSELEELVKSYPVEHGRCKVNERPAI